MSKRKFVVAKFIIFIIFVILTTYFIQNIKYKFNEFRTAKAKKTNEILNEFAIRNPKFYEEKPENFYHPKSSLLREEDEGEEIPDNSEQDKENPTSNEQTDKLLDNDINITANLDKYYIQLAIYKNEKNAKEMLRKFNKSNIRISKVTIKNIEYYKVTVDGFHTMKEAIKYRDKMVREENMKEIPLVRRKVDDE